MQNQVKSVILHQAGFHGVVDPAVNLHPYSFNWMILYNYGLGFRVRVETKFTKIIMSIDFSKAPVYSNNYNYVEPL